MHALDLVTIAVYLIAITWFGAHFRKSQRNLKDYFLGGRNAPWWAIALSIVSAETSTLTVIGTPALSFSGNFQFLQVVFGYLLARIVISALFLSMHLPSWFAAHLGVAMVPMAVVLFALSLVLGWVTRLSGTVFIAVALHLANNALSGL